MSLIVCTRSVSQPISGFSPRQHFHHSALLEPPAYPVTGGSSAVVTDRSHALWEALLHSNRGTGLQVRWKQKKTPAAGLTEQFAIVGAVSLQSEFFLRCRLVHMTTAASLNPKTNFSRLW
ncbi:hypothetical protein PBY51_001406 [Eleginops maclovinus]|uniref:Uncharacterized protein n=1 Tax=Eleginops maclovinus TaxID=56733 RepID=A0AAN7WZP9_ELEMC|nr:hypothetical protein PBY51_001406 [Eleginops maclovinus]